MSWIHLVVTTTSFECVVSSNCLHCMLHHSEHCCIIIGGTSLGCRCSRVVTFTTTRLRGPGFNPWPGQKFEKGNFCFRRTPAVVKACHPCRVRLIKRLSYPILLLM